QANKITVLDPKQSATDRAKVQEQMNTDVLRIQQFPSIRFRSTVYAAPQVEKMDLLSTANSPYVTGHNLYLFLLKPLRLAADPSGSAENTPSARLRLALPRSAT